MEFKTSFDNTTLDIIKNITLFAKRENISIYFVGGLVRDMILKRAINDIDIVVEGNAIEFCQKLENISENYKIKSIHPDFNTVKMILDEAEIDFASTREEEYPKSGCLPVVKNIGCPLRNDIQRRDFTLNSIALSINLNEDNELVFEIIDYVNGVYDLKRRKLKVLHHKSFIDDPTRILRALDFRLRFGFKLNKTAKLLEKSYLKEPNREGLSLARVDLTLRKIFSNKEIAHIAYEKIIKEDIYKIFLDETQAKKNWGNKIRKAIEYFKVENRDEAYIMAFKDTITRQMISNKELELPTNYDIYNRFKNFSPVKLALYYAITGDRRAKKFFEKLKDTKVLITGTTLLKSGYSEGTIIGKILEAVLKEKLNTNHLKNQTDELIWVKNNF